jgi:hypothetical protein
MPTVATTIEATAGDRPSPDHQIQRPAIAQGRRLRCAKAYGRLVALFDGMVRLSSSGLVAGYPVLSITSGPLSYNAISNPPQLYRL